MEQSELRQHILVSYWTLRWGMGLIAVSFPVVLWLGGLLITNTPLQISMSDYYHTPMRNAFVGFLFAVGPFLYLYHGFSRKENIALNMAGLFAIGIAIFPCDPIQENACDVYTFASLHGVCAIAFFLSIAYACIFCAGDTLYLIKDEKRRQHYNVLYKTLGAAMIVLPVVSAISSYVFQSELKEGEMIYEFVLEMLAIWVFGAFWLAKSFEIRETHADEQF